MILGRHKKLIYIFLFLFIQNTLFAEEKIQVVPLINLEELSPTFEEDKQALETDEKIELKSEKKKKITELKSDKDNKIYVNLKALDKITAKTSLIKIAIGEVKNFGKLEIKPLKCSLSQTGNVNDNVAYIQVKDLSSKDNNKVFIFNGWIFSSSPTLVSIDHPVYDLWLVDCENV